MRDPLARLRAAIRDPSAARKPQWIVEAARQGDPEAVAACLRAGADPNANWRGYRPLHALIQEKPHAGARDPDRERRTALDRLLRAGADPEQLGAWPPARAILVAAFTGIAEFVLRLEKAGAAIDGFVDSARGDAKAVGRRLAKDPGFAAARDTGGLTALQCCAASKLGADDPAVRRGLATIARKLLDSGADPNARTRSWDHDVTPSYFAVSARNLEVFGLLLERGADATEALPSALWSGDIAFAELALTHGADPDRAGEEGRPALNELIRWGQIKPALWILARGASPDRPDARGRTALHQAASRGNARMVEALLEHGADRTRRDHEGHTPREVAHEAGRDAIAEMIDGLASRSATRVSGSPGSPRPPGSMRASAARRRRRSGG